MHSGEGLQISDSRKCLSTVDDCADEDLPLACWLESLAFAARSKRPTNKPSTYGPTAFVFIHSSVLLQLSKM